MPRGAMSPELEKLKVSWSAMVDPLRYILGRYWHVAHWTLIGIAALVMVGSVTTVAAPYLFSRLVDTLQAPDWPQAVIWGFVLYALLLGLTGGLQASVSFLSWMTAETLQVIAATSFFRRLLKKQVGFFIEHNPVAIQSAQGRGAGAINMLVQLVATTIVPGVVQIGLSLAVLGATINYEIVVIVVVYGIVFIVATYFSNRYSRPFLEKAIEAEQSNAAFVGNSVTTMETLRYFGGDEWVADRFQQTATETRVAWNRWGARRILFSVVFASALAVQLIVAFAVLLPRYQEGTISIGDLVLLGSMLLLLNRPFEMIGNSIDSLLRSYSQLQPFIFMWLAPEEPDAKVGNLQLSAGRLAFEDVSFGYGDTTTVADVTFAAERGQVNFLTGETGSGKTTLFKLALKSLEPKSGRVTIDGIDLRDIARADWYSVIGVVPQEIMLMNDTLAVNIVLGREYDEERLRRAARRAAILPFIDRQPNGFETKIGERGLKLSGGERQRVAIARALYADPSILFLDEASSSLDTATEAEIMDELRSIADETTILAITHRKTVIAATDNVLQLPSRKPEGEARLADAAQ
jgi:ATP-binding cassette subfamily B protein